MGDLIVLGQHKADESKTEAGPLPPFRFPLTAEDGRKGAFVVPRELPWTPVQYFHQDETRLFAQLGPGWLEWEDDATEDGE